MGCPSGAAKADGIRLGLPGRASITARMAKSIAAFTYSATTNDLFRRGCAIRRLDNTLRTMADCEAIRQRTACGDVVRQSQIVCLPPARSQEEPVLATRR